MVAPAADSRPTEQIFASQTDAFVSASRLPDAGVQRDYLNLYEKAKRRGGDPGRNILLRGVAIDDTRVRSATRAELRESIGILKRMTATVPVAGGAVSPQLAAIASCESGGDPTAVGGGGLYRGKYQFTYETWASVGGSGDPAAAPEAEQDARAAALLARDGAGHWPVCGG
ncbi:MAG TPA: transglycosylase family protein [Thermoleophilaceae bacterium]|nr:transglycosylase family protein [Thermoleophilaceae bacterium]